MSLPKDLRMPRRGKKVDNYFSVGVHTANHQLNLQGAIQRYAGVVDLAHPLYLQLVSVTNPQKTGQTDSMQYIVVDDFGTFHKELALYLNGDAYGTVIGLLVIHTPDANQRANYNLQANSVFKSYDAGLDYLNIKFVNEDGETVSTTMNETDHTILHFHIWQE